VRARPHTPSPFQLLTCCADDIDLCGIPLRQFTCCDTSSMVERSFTQVFILLVCRRWFMIVLVRWKCQLLILL